MHKKASAHISPPSAKCYCLQRDWDLCILTCLLMITWTLHVQETSTESETRLADLKKRIKQQESEPGRTTPNSSSALMNQRSWNPSLLQIEKPGTKKKTALVQRAESAEASLKEVTAELSGLKCHISKMTSAIFGKQFEVSQLIWMHNA